MTSLFGGLQLPRKLEFSIAPDTQETKLKFKTGEAEPLRGHSATPHQPQAQLGSLAPSRKHLGALC